MSPRPPPKISLCHDWTKVKGEVLLGSKDRQPQEEVARQAKFFQPTQPIQKPICDRSGQPDITQDVISVQTCPSEENKNVRVEQTHDRSGQLDKHNVAVQDDPEVYHEIKTLNTDNEAIRERIEEDVDSNGFFEYSYHIGCAINLHSIMNSGLIPGGQILSNRQTLFFLPVDLMDKEHKDLDTIDLEAPRLAQYMHKAWKNHQNTVYWVDINLALKKGFFLSDAIERHHSS